jgi:hypothetical protein
MKMKVVEMLTFANSNLFTFGDAQFIQRSYGTCKEEFKVSMRSKVRCFYGTYRHFTETGYMQTKRTREVIIGYGLLTFDWHGDEVRSLSVSWFVQQRWAMCESELIEKIVRFDPEPYVSCRGLGQQSDNRRPRLLKVLPTHAGLFRAPLGNKCAHSTVPEIIPLSSRFLSTHRLLTNSAPSFLRLVLICLHLLNR